MRKGTTFTRFIIEEQRRIPESTGEFTLLLSAIVTACKEISDDVNRGQLINVLGSAESENVQGETQKKLDIISNEVMIKALEWSGHLAGMASEEMEEVYPIPNRYPKEVPAGVRPARWLFKHRSERVHWNHFFDSPLSRRCQ